MAKKASQSGKIRIGTSGWMYKDWGAMFYPTGMKKGFLTYLANEFSTVEINSSFYHLPLASTFDKWKDEVPDDFVFAVKLSRFITHRKKLAGVREPLTTFFNRAKHMEEKLGPILIQLPPFLKYDEKLLDSFLESLDATRTKQKRAMRFALEPRHVSWFEKPNRSEVLKRLKEADVALVFPHSRKIPSPDPDDPENLTSDFVYVRFHGPSEFAASRYGASRLKPWANRIEKWSADGLDVFVYFNNDIHGHAVVDARTLKRQLGISY
jgi:uncharacterized protein YecE (DUF72 family)